MHFRLIETSPACLEYQNADLAGQCVAPVSVFDIPQGMDGAVWVDARPVTVLARRFAGAAVTCQWGQRRNSASSGNALTLQPRGTPNHFTADGHIRFSQIYLPDRLVDRVADGLRPGSSAACTLREDLMFLADGKLDALYTDYVGAARHAASSLELEARAILIVAHLLRAYHGFGQLAAQASGGLSPFQLRRVCEAMEANLGHDMALESLAKLAGLSATHFSRAFKQSTGMPPYAWLALRRIERAKILLGSRHIPLAEIALTVGFAAQPQFTTAFRRVTGVTPGAWRRAQVL